MTSNEIKALTGQYIMNTYGRFSVAIDHGQGATLYDPEGNAYIDFTSGIGVTDLGYGYQPWVDAIAAQAKKLGHVSNLFYTGPSTFRHFSLARMPLMGRPPAMPLAKDTTSGKTPYCWKANRLPVRPTPVWTSSTSSSQYFSAHSLATAFT